MRMTRKQLEKWSKTRQMGRSRYVWRFWVLGWGIGTGVLWSILMAFDKGWNQLPMFLGLGLIDFPIAGYFLGKLMWKWSERSFEKVNQAV